jgi:hypothetical protein
MKEQIKLIAEQAGFNVSNDPIDGHDLKYELNKFAELIIRECANHIMTSSDRHRKEYFADKVLELLETK